MDPTAIVELITLLEPEAQALIVLLIHKLKGQVVVPTPIPAPLPVAPPPAP